MMPYSAPRPKGSPHAQQLPAPRWYPLVISSWGLVRVVVVTRVVVTRVVVTRVAPFVSFEEIGPPTRAVGMKPTNKLGH